MARRSTAFCFCAGDNLCSNIGGRRRLCCLVSPGCVDEGYWLDNIIERRMRGGRTFRGNSPLFPCQRTWNRAMVRNGSKSAFVVSSILDLYLVTVLCLTRRASRHPSNPNPNLVNELLGPRTTSYLGAVQQSIISNATESWSPQPNPAHQ